MRNNAALHNICHTRCCQLFNDPTHQDLTNLEQVISPMVLANSEFRWCWEACTFFCSQHPIDSSQFLVDIKYTYLLNPGLPKRCGLPIAGLAAGIENCWDWELHEDLDVENDECHPSHLVCSLCWEDLENNELNSRRQFWSICPGRFYWSKMKITSDQGHGVSKKVFWIFVRLFARVQHDVHS